LCCQNHCARVAEAHAVAGCATGCSLTASLTLMLGDATACIISACSVCALLSRCHFDQCTYHRVCLHQHVGLSRVAHKTYLVLCPGLGCGSGQGCQEVLAALADRYVCLHCVCRWGSLGVPCKPGCCWLQLCGGRPGSKRSQQVEVSEPSRSPEAGRSNVAAGLVLQTDKGPLPTQHISTRLGPGLWPLRSIWNCWEGGTLGSNFSIVSGGSLLACDCM
jgi:hypothetical protein